MGCFSGPDVPKSGLVLSLDGANYKSFKGESTTNILTNGNFSSSLTGWTSYNGATQTVQTVTNIPIYQNTPKTVSDFVSSSTVSVGNYGGTQQGVSMTAGVTYTISYYARSLSGNMTLKFSFQNGAGDENNMSHSNTLTSEWTKFTYTATLNTAKSIMFIWNQSIASGVFQLTDVQIEAKSYATIFAAGTRGTTVATGGGWADLSGTGNNGTLVNGVRESSANLGSLLFDGTDDYVSAPNTSLIHGTSNWTYSCWVNFSGTPSLGTIFENGSWTTCLLIRFETNGITIYSMGGSWGFFSFTPTLGIWYKLDFIRNGNFINFYLNGVSSQSISFTANIQPSANLFIGMSQHAPGQCFNGRIANASIYNRALTAAEIQQNFQALRGRYGI